MNVTIKPRMMSNSDPLHGNNFQLEVNAADTVYALKSRIKQQTGIHVGRQVLKKADGTVLVEGRTIGDYNIADGDQITLTMNVVSAFM